MPAPATKIAWGDCDTCSANRQELVQAWHYRFGLRALNYNNTLSPRRWLGAVYHRLFPLEQFWSIIPPFTTLGENVNPDNGTYYFPIYDTTNEEIFIGVPQIGYEKRTVVNFEDNIRFFTWKVVVSVDPRNGNITFTQEKEYLTDWLKSRLTNEEMMNLPSPWFVQLGSTFKPTITQVVNEFDEDTYSIHFDISIRRFISGQEDEYSSIRVTITDELTTENTDEVMLTYCDDLLNGNWINEDNGDTGIEWYNQIYFDANLTHNRYYFVYYNEDAAKCIKEVDGSWFEFFGGEETKKNHLWIGYQVDYSVGPEWYVPRWPVGTVMTTKTRGKLKNIFSAGVKLNRSNMDYRNIESVQYHIPFCDKGSTDGQYYVWTGDETDVENLVGECESITTLDAPEYVGKQGWYHIYL